MAVLHGDEVHVMTLVDKDQVQSLIAISLALTRDKISDTTVSDTVDGLDKFIHRELFCVTMFKEMVKCSRECQLITEGVIKKNISVWFKFKCE